MALIDIFQNLFLFLASLEGVLFRYFIELLLTSVVTYTIISEYSRSKEPEMKYLAAGFLALTLQKMLVTGYIGVHFFGKFPFILTQSRIPLFDNLFEILALILVSNAFLYPHFAKRKKTFNRKLRIEFIAASTAMLAVTIIWISILKNNMGPPNFYLFKGNFLFLVMKLYFLLNPAVYLTIIAKKTFKYRLSILIAFGIYAITPLLELINFGYFRGSIHQLYGIVTPFPLIAVLMFARVIYHKLANKISLHEQLKASEKKYQQAKEVARIKDEIVSVVSHELKTPLTSIKLYLSLLAEGEFGKLSKDQDGAIKILNDETERLELMVNDTLDLAKLEAKKNPLSLEKVDIAEFCENHPHYMVAKEKGITIETLIPDSCVVHVDLAKFQQILVNLLSNAIKFTPKGGKITIKIKSTAKKWCFSIKDTGEGIPKTKMKHLFKKFYQVSEHMTRSHGGTGLGLAIVQELVNLHKGTISVTSTVGKGTTFTIAFPKIQKA